jgi:type IV secretory pathway VirB2 component (pilin)
MITKKTFIYCIAILAVGFVVPEFAHAGLEDSLFGLKARITGVILPLLAVIGIAIGAISFFTGNDCRFYFANSSLRKDLNE